MQNEERLPERTSLLMRFFWLEDLSKIGKELNLPYFSKFAFYWEMNQYQAALEIAKAIDDEKLLSLTKRFVPRYGLSLGGFHGKYYTATESGELSFKDSTHEIRKNVKKAIQKWGDRAYGVLQAIINKNGQATYFDLIDEIERVLGYDFIPSYLLPRLSPLNLVFKTGSRKYPDWTMPSEIIPVVQEELRDFKRPSHPAPHRISTSESVLRVDRTIATLVDKIVEARRNVNLLFEKKFGTKLFRQNEMAANDIRKPCSNEEDFNNRIMSIALLVSELETDALRKFPSLEKSDGGSITLLETILGSHFPGYDRSIIKNFRTIMTLRSKKYPVHSGDPVFIDALNYFGFTDFPPDWQELWEAVLTRYLDGLHGLVTTFVSSQG
jgi:hypothetical protein